MSNLIKHGDKIKCYLGKFSNPETEEQRKTKLLEVRITPVYEGDGTYEKVEVGLEDFTFVYPDDVNNEDDDEGTVTFSLGDFYVVAYVDDARFLPASEEIEEKIKNEVIDKLGLDKNSSIEYKGDENDFFLKDLIAILKRMDVKTVIFNDGNSIDIK